MVLIISHIAISRRAGFVKINADCALVDGETHHEHRLPGICFLRGDSVAILVALICADENNKAYSLLVKQPRYEHTCEANRSGWSC
jgi:hypothetical protein